MPIFLAQAELAHANLKKEIREHQNDITVIVPVPEKGDHGFGLLIFSKDDFAKAVSLPDSNLLENDYYKMVENESDQTLPVGDLDGDNVLYNLMKAREYYLSLATETGAPTANFFKKIIVRVRADHDFNSKVHFSHKPYYDNSWYITDHTDPLDPSKGFGSEIWFLKRKAKHDKINWYSLALNSGSGALTENWLAIGNDLPEIINKYDPGIDTEKLPDVVYHEAFHWASDYPNIIQMPDSGNIVGEDYANYFGSSLSGRPTLASLRDYSSRFWTRHYKKLKPVKDDGVTFDPRGYYNSKPFVPELFWQFRDELGQARADELVWRSIKFLAGGVFETIIPEALMNALNEQTDITPDEKLDIEALLKDFAVSFVNLQKKVYRDQVITIDPVTLKIHVQDSDDGHYEKLQIQAVVDNLRSEGVVITHDDEVRLGLIPGPTSPYQNGFLHHLLKAIEVAGIDTGESLSYVVSAASGVLNAPVKFSSELVVASATGHPMRDYHTEKVKNQLAGAAGGLGALYYVNLGLSSIANPLAITLSLTGSVLVEGVICAQAPTSKNEKLKSFCKENEKILNLILGKTGHAGDLTGEKIHQGFHKIGEVLH